MLPITSYSRNQQIAGASAGCFRYYKTGFRQKKPYNLNLAYQTWNVRTTSVVPGYTTPTWCNPNSGTSGIGAAGCTAYSHVNGFAQNTAYTAANDLISTLTNSARERFIGTMKGNAGIGISLAEGRRTMGMLEKRLFQVYDFTRAIRKGRISHAAEILGVRSHPSYHRLVKDMSVRGQLRRNAVKNRILASGKYRRRLITEGDKAFADLFLEFHFGWEPIVNDIYGTIDVLQRDIPSGNVTGRSKGSLMADVIKTTNGLSVYTSTHNVNVSVCVGAKVSISNPNLALANQLGLINPAAVLWAVIPWSFLIDWFVNVGAFLESFTDTAGYKIEDPFTSIFSSDVMTHSLWYGTQFAYSYKMTSWSANRVLALPGVILKTRDSWKLSPARALTAVSLLIQQGFRHAFA